MFKAIIIVGCAASVAAAQQASVQWLGTLPGGTSSVGVGVSDDGRVVVGDSNIAADGHWRPARWVDGVGPISLPSPPGGATHMYVGAVSGDGRTVVGYFVNADDDGEAYRWTPAGGSIALGVASDRPSSNLLGASYDGSVLVGIFGGNAARWTASTGFEVLDLEWASGGYARAVSSDGTMIAGGTQNAGFLYTPTGCVRLEPLPSGPNTPYSVAYGLSPDGSVAVGHSTAQAPGSAHAAAWSPSGEPEDLGWLSCLPELPDVLMFDASSSGAEIVGGTSIGGQQTAIVWTRRLGTRSIETVLSRWYGLTMPPGTRLGRAHGITPDGLSIVGEGRGQHAEREAFVVRLSFPMRDICPADHDQDGFVTGLDFDAFIEDFEFGHPLSDYNDDCFVNGQDFDDFVVAFEEGC